MIACTPLAQLTADEREACRSYQVDSTFLHAVAQGWLGAFDDREKVSKFRQRCLEIAKNLDSAIEKYELCEDAVVYSGHGTGMAVIGALSGEPAKFVGLTYCYNGYISTSAERWKAENSLRNKASGFRMPVLLEVRLPRHQRILPLDEATGQGHEFELLLGRSVQFAIFDAAIEQVQDVQQPILRLRLARST